MWRDIFQTRKAVLVVLYSQMIIAGEQRHEGKLAQHAGNTQTCDFNACSTDAQQGC